ncbi:hypothetical protein LTR94_035600, partial [Friedmanniomyces endolithicus]
MAKDFTVAQMIDGFRNDPLEFEPGTQFRYNNSGYFLLGAIIGLSTSHRVDLDPELFLFLFLPPLLFLDGWRIPKDELLKD